MKHIYYDIEKFNNEIGQFIKSISYPWIRPYYRYKVKKAIDGFDHFQESLNKIPDVICEDTEFHICTDLNKEDTINFKMRIEDDATFMVTSGH